MNLRKIALILIPVLLIITAISVCSVGVALIDSDGIRSEIRKLSLKEETLTATATQNGVPTQLVIPTFTPTVATSPTPIIVTEPGVGYTPAIEDATALGVTPPPAPSPVLPTQTLSPLIFDSWCVPWHTEATRAKVLRVIDGISIEVQIDNQNYFIRYIGLSLPTEPNLTQIITEAANKNYDLVFGKEVLLVRDKTNVDEEGFLPRYVIAEGVLVNFILVKEGYALASSIPPDTNCAYQLEEAANNAIASEAGMWAPVATPTRPIIFHPTATLATTGAMIITKIQPLGVGWEDPDEYVEFRNVSDFPIQLQGWRLNDLKGHSYIFPKFTINPGNYCRVYTNAYLPEHCGLSAYSLSPVWNDLQDCGYLLDSSGTIIDEFCYGF